MIAFFTIYADTTEKEDRVMLHLPCTQKEAFTIASIYSLIPNVFRVQVYSDIIDPHEISGIRMKTIYGYSSDFMQ